MDITTFLALVWGPVMFAVGLGMFVSRSYYIRVYRDLEKDPLAVLIFGMVAMMVGIILVTLHNVWSTVPQIIVGLLNWGLLIKGVTFVVIPRWVERAGDKWATLNLIPATGAFMVAVGAYLSWVAYFAG